MDSAPLYILFWLAYLGCTAVEFTFLGMTAQSLHQSVPYHTMFSSFSIQMPVDTAVETRKAEMMVCN